MRRVAPMEDGFMLFFPSVRIGRGDWCRLMQLAFAPEHRNHPVAAFLRSEVHRAIVTAESNLNEIVHMNGCVTYRLDGQEPVEQVLVHPDDYRGSEQDLSVLTSLGAALIGIRVGDAMPFASANGKLHVVTPLAVRADSKRLTFGSPSGAK
jgi:hypothetical protein